ncbi:MAG: alpha/beta hydrolase [Sphingomonas sp.]|uniref:alpha/beta hydrolase n=1 Tax=Sphingomonas sp. TaxID=28214 RepID=UPI001AC7B1CD|nr:alpha/beta hydrolase-fold protein [Sphingomonas sp.]MBN8816248.1 alpha/beta hydrolase [Sphingomonas sp.]
MTAALPNAASGFTPLPRPGRRGALFVHHLAGSYGLLPRDVFVWVPDAPVPQGGFPVLYLQDGQNLFDARLVPFGTAWEADRSVSRLVDAGGIVPVMVVGIASTAERFTDYAPASMMAQLPAPARAAVELAWGGRARSADYARLVIEDVKPLIDRHFPTRPDPEATFVGGSSLGAMAALEILSAYPDQVGGALCLSAHFSLLPVTGTEQLPAGFGADVTAAAAGFAADLPRAGRHVLWIDRSALGIDRFYGPSHTAVADVLKARGFIQDVDLVMRCYPGVGHDEGAWRDRLDDALSFLLACRTG